MIARRKLRAGNSPRARAIAGAASGRFGEFRGCLVLAVAVAVATLAQANAAAEGDCEELPEAQRTHCQKVVDCMAIDDPDIRRVCLHAAGQSAEAPQSRVQPQARVQDPQPSMPAALPEETLGSAPPGQAEPSPESLPPVPPDRFRAKVTGIHQSILDRQVIALDDSYVFVGEHARRARLEVGHVVEVHRISSRFGSGRMWRISGPSRSPVEVFRVRCESDDVGRDDRRRCEQMLARR